MRRSEAIEVARAAGDEVSELRALDGMGVALFGLARYDEGERTLREALDRMRDGGLVHFLHTHVNLADALCGAGRLREARADRRRGRRARRRAGRPAPLADDAAGGAGLRGRRLGRGRGRAAVARAPGDGHDLHQRRAAPDRARARPRRPRRRAPPARRGRRRRRRHARAAVDRAAGLAAGGARAAHGRSRRRPPGDRRRAGPAGLLLAGRRRGWRAWRRPARAWRPTPPCGRATSARTRRSRSAPPRR